MGFPRKNSVLGQFSVNFPPPQPPSIADIINIVVSASLKQGLTLKLSEGGGILAPQISEA